MLYTAKQYDKNLLWRKMKAGQIKPIYRGMFIDAFEDEKKAIEKYFIQIIEYLFGKACLSASTSLSFSANKKHFFVRSQHKKVCKVGDYFFISSGFLKNGYNKFYHLFYGETIFVPDLELAILENMCQHKNPNKSISNIEEYLIKKIDVLDFKKIDELVSLNPKKFGKAKEKLFQIIGKIKGTKPIQPTDSKNLKILNSGLEIDVARIKKFEGLKDVLKHIQPHTIQNFFLLNQVQFENFCFLESYFSNYIEGSELTLDEAIEVMQGTTSIGKPKDSHDFQSHYYFSLKFYPKVFSSSHLRILKDSETFINFIKKIHFELNKRNLKDAGKFKTQKNHVGNYVFVEPAKVEGTLKRAFEIGETLNEYQKAFYYSFVISEIHPFSDGNGRLSRIVMNYFLIRGGVSPIIVSNAFRDSYLSGLREASKYDKYMIYIRKLQDICIHNNTYNFSILPKMNPIRNEIESWEEKYRNQNLGDINDLF